MKHLFRQPFVQILLAVILLIAIDQGLKCLVHATVAGGEELLSVTNTLHIHPYLNDEDAVQMQPTADEKGMDVRLLLVLRSLPKDLFFYALLFLIYGWLRFLFWDLSMPRLPLLTRGGLALFLSGTLCSGYIDEIFWGGSLDYICLALDRRVSAGDHYQTVPRHIIFDTKDIYLTVGIAFLILFALRIWVWAMRICRDKDVSKKIDQRILHPIKSIRSMREAKSSAEAESEK